VLKTAHLDVNLNYEIFLKPTNFAEVINPKQLLVLMQDYLIQLLNDRKFALTLPFTIDKLMSEAALIFRMAI
jgi:hypothetical protein